MADEAPQAWFRACMEDFPVLKTKMLSLDRLEGELDQLFTINDWDQDPAMSRWVPQVYRDIGYDYAKVFEVAFCERHNGLMMRSGNMVQEVFCAAFPSPEIIERVLATTRGDALLFLHHPIDMEVSGTGFHPILPVYLERLKTQGVSVYVCHAPMDCHDQIGTNASIVEAFGILVEKGFARYGNGYAGRLGSIDPVGLDELVNKGMQVFGVKRVDVGGARPDIITKVAIVAGGGDEVALFEEAEDWGAHTFITGEWYTRTKPQDDQGQIWAEANRAACQAYAEASSMALLGFSHAASEFLVMKRQMADYFTRKDLQVECLAQSDWWR